METFLLCDLHRSNVKWHLCQDNLIGSYVEGVKCHTIVEQSFKLILSWGQKCFSTTSDSFSDGTEVCVCIFTPWLVFESLKGSVKGSIWSAGKTISIGRLLGSGFAEKNASSTIYGINKPNLLTHKLGTL